MKYPDSQRFSQELSSFDHSPKLALLALALAVASFLPLRAETLSGQVIPATIQGSLAGAQLAIFADGTRGSVIGQSHQSMTDADGNFSFTLPPGDWAIRLDHKEAARRGILIPLAFHPLSAGRNLSDIKLEVFRPEFQVLGTIKTDTGAPLSDIPISGEMTGVTGTYSVNTQSDNSGAFAFSVIPGDWIFFPWNLPEAYSKPKSQTIAIAMDTELSFVALPDIPGLQITETTLPDGIAGEPYKARLNATGGSQPFQWSVPDGSQLPAQLTLSEFTGELKGILTQSGRLRFDVQVKQLSGSRAGTETIELFVHPDETAPTIASVTPSSFTPARDNTVTAIHFSEPMTKIEIGVPDVDRLAIQWTPSPLVSLQDFSPNSFQYSWNQSGDTFYISHPEPLPIGSHTWTFNPDLPPVKPGEKVPLLFEDASGNPIAPRTSRTQSIRTSQVTEDEQGQALIYRDVEEILLLKEQLQEQDGKTSSFRAATLDFTIGLPDRTFNTVSSASLTFPDDEIVDVPYFGFVDGGSSLHILKLVGRFEDLNRRYPNGLYTVNLETFHDGILSLPLNLSEDDYPKAALISNTCNIHHLFHDEDFSLSLLNATAPRDADIIQVVINNTKGKKLHSLRESPGGVFEQFLTGNSAPSTIQNGPFGEETVTTIPAGSLEPNTDYFGYIRKIKIADENTSYDGVRVIGGYSTVTEFTLSTKNPRTSCPSVSLPLLFWIGREPLAESPQAATPGSLLPELFTTETDETSTAEFNIGSASKITLAPNSIGTFDSSGNSHRATLLDLPNGSAEISISAFDLGGSELLASTPIVTLELTTATLKVSHSQILEQTTVEVAEGTVLATRNDSTLPPVTLVAGEVIEFSSVAPPTPTLPPVLHIEPVQGNSLRLSWSHSTSDWQLFESDSISLGIWNPVLALPTQTENMFGVVLEPEKNQRFFRLQKLPIAND